MNMQKRILILYSKQRILYKMIAPTIKTLTKAIPELSLGQCKIARKLMKEEICPESFDSVEKWVNQCYHKPITIELILCALNEVLEGFGVEPIRDENSWNRYYGDIAAEYINLGDTYINTIMYIPEQSRFICCSWGDYVESKGL
jgi:hypothetical protein